MAGFVALAQVPYTGVPTGTDAGPGNLREDIPSTPADFGGSIGAAEQKLGADIGSGGEKVFQAGIAQQEMYNKASVQHATNQALDIGTNVLYDPDKGYLTMQGKTAMDNYASTVTTIKSKFQDLRDGLANDMQRTQFDEGARRYLYYYEREAGAHADLQAKQWYNQTDQATIKNNVQKTAISYNNPGLTESLMDGVYSSIHQTAQRNGESPEVVELKTRTAQMGAAVGQFSARSLTDPQGAIDWLNNGTMPGPLVADPNKPGQFMRSQVKVNDLFDEAGRESIVRPVLNKMQHAAAVDIANEATSGRGGSGGVYQPGTPFVPKNLPSTITPDEDAMVRTISGEAGREPLQGQQAVAAVIMNRSKGAGVTPRDVVFAPNQFEPWNGGDARARMEAMDPGSAQYQSILNNAVRPIMSGHAQDPTNGATHFYAPKVMTERGGPPSWDTGQPSTVIGNHKFLNIGYGSNPSGSPAATGPAATSAGSHNPDAFGIESQMMQRAHDLAVQRFPNDPSLQKIAEQETWQKIQRDNVLQQKYETAVVKQRKDAQDAAESEYMPNIITDPTKVDTNKLANDPRIDPTKRFQLFQMVHSSLNDQNKIAAVSHQTAISLLDKIRAPNGDPSRITDLEPIYDAYSHSSLTNADFAFVKNEFTNLRAPDGEQLGQKTKEFLEAVKGSVVKSNPLMGQLDMTGGTNFFRLQQDIAGKIADYRKQGKDPHALFDPGKPDFVGSEKNLAQYQKSIPESMDQIRQRLAPAAPSPSTAAPSPPAVSPAGPRVTPPIVPAAPIRYFGPYGIWNLFHYETDQSGAVQPKPAIPLDQIFGKPPG